MADYITLMGAEEVTRASSRMSEAAAEMQRAASSIAYAIEQLRMILEDDRQQRMAEKAKGGGGDGA